LSLIRKPYTKYTVKKRKNQTITHTKRRTICTNPHIQS